MSQEPPPTLARRPPQPPITFGSTVGAALRKSFQGSGRASRSEFWLFTLFYVVVSWGPLMIGGALDNDWITAVGFIAYLGLLIPFITAGVRRLHDTGRTGAWGLLLLTIAFFVVLVLWTEPSQPHVNRFGP
ncbi:DUF805 domain-containing protein [Saccharopolyspora sp. K220]|uniref:DUF805 domain-containing protein n=1 Tax=Saccharopolyspora soli TaxID=2926618 RepID=UPI001F55B68A|nr:DUF805 domain-containing protein [Saccharopolyspora soli]MCI2422748.1 DUF805 domain-containing protein [Saccharopolyspora soli]